MLRYYPWRWIYSSVSSLLLCLIGFYYDLYPYYCQLVLARKTNLQLQRVTHWQQINLKQLTRQVNSVAMTEGADHERINQLVKRLQQYGLSLQSMEVLSGRKNINALEVHLVLQGAISQWLAFLTDFETVFIETFSIKDGAKLTIEMVIKLLQTIPGSPRLNASQLRDDDHDPFCVAGTLLNYPDMPSINTISLDHLKMVGFMRLGQKKQALLASSDHVLWAVGTGSLIGQERARTMAITAHQMDIQLADGTVRQMTMEDTNHF